MKQLEWRLYMETLYATSRVSSHQTTTSNRLREKIHAFGIRVSCVLQHLRNRAYTSSMWTERGYYPTSATVETGCCKTNGPYSSERGKNPPTPNHLLRHLIEDAGHSKNTSLVRAPSCSVTKTSCTNAVNSSTTSSSGPSAPFPTHPPPHLLHQKP